MRDLIFEAISQIEEGLTSHEICEQAMHMKNIDADMAYRIVSPLLRNDVRFFLDTDGRWKLVRQRSCPPEIIQDQPLQEITYSIVDVETTGMRPPADRVIEVGVVKVYQEKIVDRYDTLINPNRSLPPFITGMTGIRPEMLRNAPEAKDVFPGVLDMLDETVFVAHHARFDYKFCSAEFSRLDSEPFDPPLLCTVKLGRRLVPGLRSYNLESLANHFGFRFEERHRALGDAQVTAMIFIEYLKLLTEKGIKTFGEVQTLEKSKIKRTPSVTG